MRSPGSKITLSLLLGATLTGVSGASALAQDQVSLSLWKAPHSAEDEAFFRGKLDAFEAEHPGVSVEFRVTPWDTWVETYTSAFAGSAPPDVHYGVGIYYPKLVEAGGLLALDEAFPDEMAALTPAFDASLWERGSLNGHQYGIPAIQAGISFVWNKSLFEAAGLDPETPPATWEEVRAFAEQIAEKVPGTYGYGLLDNSTGEMLNFYPSTLMNFGATMMTSDGSDWAFDSPEAIAGLDFLVSMYADGLMPRFGMFPGHDLDTAFVEGKVAMMLTYASYIVPLLADHPDFGLGISSTPCGPANCLSLGAGGYWMLSQKSAHPAEALELAAYLSSPEVLADYVKLVNLFGSRVDSNPWEGDAVMAAFQETQRDYGLLPQLPFDYWAILNPEIENALTGASSAEEALRSAGDQIRAKLAQP